MRTRRRVHVAVMSLAVALSLAGCGTSSTPDFDPTGLLDFLDTKKPLPGERKPVFPEGVPGVERGVPKELTKGYQQQQAETPPDQPTETEKRAVPEKPKPVKKAAAKKKLAPRVQPEPVEEEAPPAAQRPASPQQPAANPFPAPLPSGSFSR
jgi:outer membrane biosynthesis protein TonB